MQKCPLRICALIPTYNNSGTICDVVVRTISYIKDIIVVIDGSTDDSAQRLQSLSLPITIVSYAHNQGKGAALKKGFDVAKSMGFDYVLTIDGDGQHFPEDIPNLITEELNHPGSLILGKRGLVQENMPTRNTFANRFSNFWFAVQTGKRMKDTQSGMRIYPIYKYKHLNFLTSRYESELELLVFSAWKNIQIIEVPIRVYYPPKSERVSHFKPFYDFTRISVLNCFLCIIALIYGLPRRLGPSILYELRIFFWSVFALIPYFVALSICVNDKQKRQMKMHSIVQKICSHLIYTVPQCNFSVAGKKFQTDTNIPHMYIANHASLLDVFAVLSQFPKLIIITKDWVRNNWVFGWCARSLGFCSVSDGFEKIREHLAKYVEEGYSVLIFPEGTRSNDGHVGHFHTGAFAIAEALQLDIQPLAIHNSFNVLNRHELCIYPHNDFFLEYLPVVYVNDYSFGRGYRHQTKSFELHYRNRLSVPVKPKVYILGAGVGGLFTACLLSEAGYIVDVLEQLPVPGGGLYSYCKLDEWWQTGIHTVCGMGEDEFVGEMLKRWHISCDVQKCGNDIIHGECSTSHLSLLFNGESGNQEHVQIISDMMSEASYHFVGGTNSLVENLCKYISRHGGRVILNERVRRLEIENHNVRWITTDNHSYDAHDAVVISSLHPKMLLNLCSAPIYHPSTTKRILETKESHGCFKLHIKFKERSFLYSNNNHFIVPDNIFFYMQPAANQGEWAHTMEVICPLDYGTLKEWYNNRKDNYETYVKFKEEWTKVLLGKLTDLYPNFSDVVADVFSATSLTYRDDYLSPEGAMFGMAQPVGACETKCGNLYLTGQNCFVHGFYGTIKTSQLLVDKITAKYE